MKQHSGLKRQDRLPKKGNISFGSTYKPHFFPFGNLCIKKQEFRVPHVNPLRTEFRLNNIYKFSSYLTGNIKTSQLMSFREMIAVYCENQMKHTNTVFWKVC
jgi:hypothetical protein